MRHLKCILCREGVSLPLGEELCGKPTAFVHMLLLRVFVQLLGLDKSWGSEGGFSHVWGGAGAVARYDRLCVICT